MSRPIDGSVLRRGAHVELLALSPALYEPLYEELMVPEVANTWRPRGQYVPLAGWERFLVDGMEFAAVVRSVESREFVGFVELRDVAIIDGHGYVSAAAVRKHVGSGLMVEAVALFLDETFARSQLHKVYVLLSEQSRRSLAGILGRFLEVEGTFVGHVVILGQRQDVIVASISREQFTDQVSRVPILRCLGGAGGWRLPITNAVPASPLGPALGVGGLDLSSLPPTTRLSDLGLDSLARLELIIAVEDALGRTAPDDLIASIETVGDLIGWVEAART